MTKQLIAFLLLTSAAGTTLAKEDVILRQLQQIYNQENPGNFIRIHNEENPFEEDFEEEDLEEGNIEEENEGMIEENTDEEDSAVTELSNFISGTTEALINEAEQILREQDTEATSAVEDINAALLDFHQEQDTSTTPGTPQDQIRHTQDIPTPNAPVAPEGNIFARRNALLLPAPSFPFHLFNTNDNDEELEENTQEEEAKTPEDQILHTQDIPTPSTPIANRRIRRRITFNSIPFTLFNTNNNDEESEEDTLTETPKTPEDQILHTQDIPTPSAPIANRRIRRNIRLNSIPFDLSNANNNNNNVSL